jgi:cyclopropane fatty-acyl-phospholipid synthase-like methyltransferase
VLQQNTMAEKPTQQSAIDRRYYDRGYYGKHLDRFEKKDRFTRVKVSRVLALLAPKEGERIVDLGCGVGTMMAFCASTGAFLIGMDYSSDSLALARECFGKQATDRVFRGICCDGRMMPVKEGSVDGIMAVDFTEHLDDATLAPTIGEAFRILRKGGRFVIYTPSKTHLFERLKKHNIILKRDNSHIGMRTMKEYCAMLVSAGFTVRKSLFAPTDIPGFNAVERAVMHLPFVAGLARRRICILAVK